MTLRADGDMVRVKEEGAMQPDGSLTVLRSLKFVFARLP